jgi:hypothetical protein
VLQALALWFLNLAGRRVEATPLMYLTALLPIAVGAILVLYGYELRRRFILGQPAQAVA